MDESIMKHHRRTRRAPVLLTATIEVAGVPKPVKLRNLSEEGALIQGDHLPIEGSTTFFERNELRVKGRVVWVLGEYAGVAFVRPLQPDEVLRNVPQPRRPIQPEFRRPGLACRPLTSDERRMIERWMTATSVSPLGE
jgi:PilZ domain